jgi:3-isopropylmalate/(R)-2-methylmalate dehydratase small subunit
MSGPEQTTGRAWVLGDDIDTDVLAPGLYMKSPLAELASHCLETVEPLFAATVKPGDVIVAGRNFGMGSSREQAAEALKHLGIAAVVARSFAGIFYRNAINLGLPAVTCDRAGEISDGDRVTVDPEAGRIDDHTSATVIPCEVIPDHLMAMIRDGGLVPHLEKRLQQGAA